MPKPDQLEVISQNGAVAFHDLDPGKGLTNIGRHPENDIVIDSPTVADFHAILDHRQPPYQIMLLDQEGRATLGGQPLQTNVSRELHNWDTIEIDGHAIVLLQDDDPSPPPRPSDTQLTPFIPILPGPHLPMRPADQPDDVIIADLSQREWVIDCNQTATCQITIINGGDLVALFKVSVEELDPDWVFIAPPTINLHEGERGTITIGMTPPRRPSSRAGDHHFSVRVTSPDYPDRACGRGATLTINPYYEFAIGDLSPRQQTVSWTKRTGQAALAITNQGNAEATFRLDGEDDQRGCEFEFQPPGSAAGRSARQTEVRVPPDVIATVPIFITPLKRRVFGLRKHNYALTITTTLLQEKQTPRSVFGTLAAAPLIGLWLLLLIAALLIALVFWIFHPYIVTFIGTNGCKTDCIIDGGKPLELSWTASPFVALKLEQSANSDGNFQVVAPVDGPASRQNLTPLNTVTYRLVGDNFLSTLFPVLQAVSDPVIVAVRPRPPVIELFDADGAKDHYKEILLGESATLLWRVVGADTLMLKSNNIEQSVTPTETGHLSVKPDTNTTYQLNALNVFGTAEPPPPVKLSVVTITPTPTPVPPDIVFFAASANPVVRGNDDAKALKLKWRVTGQTTAIELSGPDIGQITGLSREDEFSAPADQVKLYVYVLTAYNGNSKTAKDLQVRVEEPTPTPTPTPLPPTGTPSPTPPPNPVIDYFKAFSASSNPDDVVRDMSDEDSNDYTWVYTVVVGTPVKFTWLVHNTTKLSFGGVDMPAFINDMQDTLVVKDVKPIYQLLAVNATNAPASRRVKIKILPKMPDAPTDIKGIDSPTAPITITWKYNPAFVDAIIGFRVYRTTFSDTDPGTTFERVADVDQLNREARQFPDPLDNPPTPTCGKRYYVVAVYNDLDDNKLESGTSLSSWNSVPCQIP